MRNVARFSAALLMFAGSAAALAGEAQAADTSVLGTTCGMATYGSTMIRTQQGVVWGGPVAAEAGSPVLIRCTILVNGVPVNVQHGETAAVSILAPTTVAYSVSLMDRVELCTDVFRDGAVTRYDADPGLPGDQCAHVEASFAGSTAVYVKVPDPMTGGYYCAQVHRPIRQGVCFPYPSQLPPPPWIGEYEICVPTLEPTVPQLCVFNPLSLVPPLAVSEPV